MAGIFMSYRQTDSKAWAIGLRDDLAKAFGEELVFLDKDALGPGNWREQLQRALERCSVVLVVTGKQWLTITDEQNRPRITLADDVHRQEIALALSHKGVTVIPVLVDDAVMPKTEQLPKDIRGLTDQQAYKIGDTKARRKVDLEVLIKSIETVSGLTAKPDKTAPDSAKGHPPWYKLDYTAVGIAFLLTLILVMLEFGSVEFTKNETFVLLIVCYGIALGGRRLWRLISNRQRRGV